MDGDIPPLDKIYEVASARGLMLMVDDAHGEGVMGKGGRGIVDHFNLHGKVDVEIGTLSKAFGVVGGVVAGKAVVVEWLRQRGRPFLFSSAVTAADAAACIASLDILEQSTELVDRLWENTRYFKEEMAQLGFDTGMSVTPLLQLCWVKLRWRSSSHASCLKKAYLPWQSVSPLCRAEKRASA
jgi:glycine C-acetyltransferase